MNRITIIFLLTAVLVSGPALPQDEEKSIVVQASSFTDSSVLLVPGEECAVALQYLKRDLKYQLIAATGVQGPPGTVYTLEDPKREIAIVKCGRGGDCGETHDEGRGD